MECRYQYNYNITTIVTTVKSIIVRAAENNVGAVLSGKVGRKSFFDDEEKELFNSTKMFPHIGPFL